MDYHINLAKFETLATVLNAAAPGWRVMQVVPAPIEAADVADYVVIFERAGAVRDDSR